MRRALALVTLAACNRAFGVTHVDPPDAAAIDAAAIDAAPDAPVIDLDGDGVPDSLDPCIAAAGDANGNIDADLLPNGVDPCPLYGLPTSGDMDGDGLPDQCDPEATQPDHLRCMMAFSDTTLNGLLWIARPPFLAFADKPGQLSCNAGQSCAIVAAEPVTTALPLTYYDVRFTSTFDTATTGAIAIWPRMGTSSADAVGCIFYRDTGGYHYAIERGGVPLATHSLGGSPTSVLLMRASITSGATPTITCNAVFAGPFIATDEISDAIPQGATGELGFSSAGWDTSLIGLVIDD